MKTTKPEFAKMMKEEHREDSEIIIRIGKLMRGHCASVSSILHIPEPHNIIVSSAGEKQIMVWNALTFRRKSLILCHMSPVRHVIQWNENVILSCDQVSCIYASEVTRPHKVIRRTQLTTDRDQIRVLYKLLKIDEETFLAVDSRSIYFINYSTFEQNANRRISCGQLNVPKINGSVSLFTSKTRNNCIFIKLPILTPNQERGEIVHLLDYQEPQILRSFRLFPCKKTIYAVESFLNSRGEEMVVLGGCDKTLSFFNTSFGELPGVHTISVPYKTISVENWIYSFKVIEDRFLMLGDNRGFVHVFDTYAIHEPRMTKKRVHQGGINQIVSFGDNKRIVLLTGSNDKTVGVSWVNNKFVTKEFAVLDLKERIEYVFLEFESLLEESDLLRIQLYHKSLLVMFKGLIL